jgi:hypothetical protein
MSIGYQADDRNIVDYKLWVLPDFGPQLRGPRRWTGDHPFITFLGAAQTFGRFVKKPFAQTFSDIFGVDHLNFGSAGAGPEYYVGKDTVTNYVNRSQFCVIQVMSGRSVSTSILESIHGGGLLKFRTGPRAGESAMAADAYRILARDYGEQVLKQQVAEARAQWTSCYNILLDSITVPTVLLWMSTRRMSEEADNDSAGNLGEFPHLIGRAELDAITREGVTVVDALIEKPTYMRLINAVTGDPCLGFDKKAHPNHPEWARDLNVYYFTETQHEQTAVALARACIAKDNSHLRSLLVARNEGPNS